jgi:hypothetical protein
MEDLPNLGFMMLSHYGGDGSHPKSDTDGGGQ